MRAHAGAGGHAVEQHRHLRLADRADHGLARVLVARDRDRGVGLAALLEKREQLVLRAALVGLDRHAVQRVGEAERRGLDLAGHRQRVAGPRADLGHHHDVAGLGGLHLGHVAAHHAVDVGEALGLARAGARELQARRDGAGQHLHQREAPVLRVVKYLEHEAHRAVVARVDVEEVAVHERHAAKVAGRREVRLDVVEQAGHALLARARAHEHRHEDTLGNGLGEQALQLVLGELLVAVEILEHELVVGLDHQLAETRACLLGGVGHLGGNVARDGLALVVEVAGLHADKVDDALEVVAHTPWQRHRAETGAKALLEPGKGLVVVSLGTVDAVHEHGAGQRQVLGRIPQARGHRARLAGGVHHEHGRLHGAHGGIGVANEVRVAGGVDDVQARAPPGDRRHGELDREGALLFLGVVVKRGLGALVATQAVGDA